MRTYQQTTAEATHDWFIVDAAGQRLGTLAVKIARTLSGRKKPTWTPHIDAGDFVVVINAGKIELGGDKWNQKVYFEDGLQSLLQVSSIPTTIILGKKGEIFTRMIGYLPDRFVDMLTDRVNEALGKPHNAANAISQ